MGNPLDGSMEVAVAGVTDGLLLLVGESSRWLLLACAGFRRLYEQASGIEAERCSLCRQLMKHQMVPTKQTLCYQNSTWQQANVKAVAKTDTPIIRELKKKKKRPPAVQASPAAVQASPALSPAPVVT
jgi:hypothetical protein